MIGLPPHLLPERRSSYTSSAISSSPSARIRDRDLFPSASAASGRRWGTTDYRVSLIPLGGYVKLGGDESNAGIEEGSGESDIPAGERFDLRPRWQKFLVAVAGPVMNVLTAIAIPFVAAMMVGVPATPSPVVAQVDDGGAAQVAGLKPGDRIVSFKGEENPTWRRISGLGMLSPDIEVPLVVERGAERVPLKIKPVRETQGSNVVGELGFDPDLGMFPVTVRGVRPDAPASKAGLTPGDRIISINDQPGATTDTSYRPSRRPRGRFASR